MQNTNIIKSVLILLIFNLLLTGCCFAQNNSIQAPETFEQAQEIGEKALEVGKEELPDIIKDIWHNDVLPIWQKMYDWFYENIWLEVKDPFGSRVEQEIEIRKEIVDQEFEQEKKEVKKELPGILDKTWKFIRDVVRKFKILWK